MFLSRIDFFISSKFDEKMLGEGHHSLRCNAMFLKLLVKEPFLTAKEACVLNLLAELNRF